MEKLAIEFAELYRATKIAQGQIYPNMDVAVQFAVEAMVSDCMRSSDPIALMTDEVAFQRECLERIVK